MICLNDLLSKIDNVTTDSGENFRVAFTDNIELIEDDIGDITDLVSRIRNAACHMSSDIRIVNEPEVGGVVSFVFNIVEGKSRIKVINDFVIECEFEDDIAIYYGVLRIYLKRHIHRALDEAKQIILPLIRPHFYR